MTPIIRTATLADVPHIAAIHIASWQAVYQGHFPADILAALSLEKRKEQWHKLISEGAQILIIEIPDNMIGFASIGPARDKTHYLHCGEINAIYLHPQFWRQGYGKQLASAALEKLTQDGFRDVILWVLEANLHARKFYDELGFTCTGESKLEKLDVNRLGIPPEEQMSEGATVVFREICYYKTL